MPKKSLTGKTAASEASGNSGTDKKKHEKPSGPIQNSALFKLLKAAQDGKVSDAKRRVEQSAPADDAHSDTTKKISGDSSSNSRSASSSSSSSSSSQTPSQSQSPRVL